MNESSKNSSLDLIFDLAWKKLMYQAQQWNAIDQKNAIVLAVYGILLTIFATFDASSFKDLPRPVLGIASLVWIALIALGMGCSIISILPKLINVPPNIPMLIKKYLHTEPSETKDIMLSNIEKSIKENEDVLDRKMKYLEMSVKYFLILSLGTAIVFIIFRIFIGR